MTATTPDAEQRADAVKEEPTSYSRRATLIFLGSIGVTLLVTGATGSRMLKRATNKANPPAASGPVPSAPALLARRSSRRLKDLFAITASAQPNDAQSLSKLDFRTNQQFARSLVAPRPAINPDAPATDPVIEADPAMDAIVDAVKAFSIATFMLLGGTGLIGYGLARRFGSTDLESFMQSLRHELMGPFARAMEPPLPAWLKQKPRNPEDELKDSLEEYELRKVLKEEWRDFLVETNQADGSEKDLTAVSNTSRP